MPNDNYKPEPIKKLTNDIEIHAYVNSTRMSILYLLGDSAATVTQIARKLDTHPANLTHHFRILEKAGLIQLVEKRDTGRNLEKFYRAVALSFLPTPGDIVDKRVLKLSILRDELTASMQRMSRNKEDGDVFVRLLVTRISKENLKKFQEKLNQLIQEFEKAETSGGSDYVMALSLFPGLAGEGAKKKIRIR